MSLSSMSRLTTTPAKISDPPAVSMLTDTPIAYSGCVVVVLAKKLTSPGVRVLFIFVR